jgi:hypothetical protein
MEMRRSECDPKARDVGFVVNKFGFGCFFPSISVSFTKSHSIKYSKIVKRSAIIDATLSMKFRD